VLHVLNHEIKPSGQSTTLGKCEQFEFLENSAPLHEIICTSERCSYSVHKFLLHLILELLNKIQPKIILLNHTDQSELQLYLKASINFYDYLSYPQQIKMFGQQLLSSNNFDTMKHFMKWMSVSKTKWIPAVTVTSHAWANFNII
jgi:hypothetical protein